MKAKNISLVAVGMILVAAIAVGYLIARPGLFVGKKSMPVFMGEQILVNREVATIKAVSMIKAQSVPVPQPKIVTPLPIFPPKVTYQVLPKYPVSALREGLEGTTLLSIYVGASGKAEQVAVKSSSGVAELDQSAVAAISQWKFNPATQGGMAVASWFELPVRFEVK